MMTRIDVDLAYKGREPALDVKLAIRALLDDVPPEMVLGLERVVVTYAADRSRRARRGRMWSGGRKAREARVRALYHRAFAGHAAWIELFVDRVLGDVPRVVQRVGFVRDLLLGPVLYHEVGHHIAAIRGGRGGAAEDVADWWSKELMARFFRKKYWYAVPFMRLVTSLSKRKRLAHRHPTSS
jgi:hypothetical protein